MGTTVYEPSEILAFAAQIVAQRTGAVRVDDLAATLELLYHEDGYFLAEVFVAEDGRTLIVDEGEIGQISIEGVDARTFALIQSYMEPVIGQRAVTQKAFERAIMLVEDIESISAVAEIDYPPGAQTARVRILATPEDRSWGYLTLDHPSRGFGDEAVLTFGQQFLSAFTPGDMLRLELSGSSEQNGDTVWGALTYRAPIGGSGAFGEAYFGGVTARRDASGTLAATDIRGNTAILALGFPFVRDVDTYGYGTFELRRSASDVDVNGLSFESDVNVIGASWIYGKALPHGGAFEYAINLSVGERDNGSLVFDDGDSSFFHLRVGAGLERPVSWFGPNSAVRAEFWAQYTQDRLPGIEEFHLGGRNDDRGFLFAEVQGDIGVSATLEVGRDIFPSSGLLHRFRPFGFVDIGYVRNNSPSATEIDDITLASLGIGMDAELPNGLFIRSYVAAPLTDGVSTDAGDSAFYLGLTKSW